MAAKHEGMGWNVGGVETRFIVEPARCYELQTGSSGAAMNAESMAFIE
jgi:hypothetical protein